MPGVWGGSEGGVTGGTPVRDGESKTAHRGLKRGKAAFRSFPLKERWVESEDLF